MIFNLLSYMTENLTTEKLEPANIWHFYLITELIIS